MIQRPAPTDNIDAQGQDANDVLCSLKQINKTFDGKTRVVDGLDLEVRNGEFLTLLGPSGSGKTTTLMMLAGFEEPTSGSISLEGRSLLGMPPYRRNIGMVFQNYALFPHMTVKENLAFPLRMRGVSKSKREARVREILDTVHLPEVSDRRPKQLSGGQQQRIALARSLIFQPKLVLMDEPLGALDKQLREHMQVEIKRLHSELGVTIVYVTHDQSEALTMSDRIAVFADGRIQQIAPPRDIYERPQNAFVANFIGDNNCVTGEVVSREGDEYKVDCGQGVEMVGVAQTEFTKGDRVQILFRPEKMLPDRPVSPESNRLNVDIFERLYLGDHVQVRGRLANGVEVAFKASSENQVSKIEHIENMEGNWKIADCLLFPADNE